MAGLTEEQLLVIKLLLDDSQFQKGLKRAGLGLQQQAATIRAYAAEQRALAQSIATRQAQVLSGIPAIQRGYRTAAAEASTLFNRIDKNIARAERSAATTLTANRRTAARLATQGLANLERQAMAEAARQTAYRLGQEKLGQQALTKRAALAKQAWSAEVAGINAATAAQMRYNEVAASQTVGARFNKGLTAPTGRLAQIGVSAVGGGLKFLERSFLVTAAAGAVLESQFFKVQDAQAAMARTLEGESLPTLTKLNEEILQLSRVVPLPITELYRLAEVAGTVGIAGKDIAQFTEIVARLTATTDLTADEASQQLGRLLNIFDLTVAEADNLSSALIKLSVSQASSDQEILTATERFASLGKAMGFTAAQLLAIGSAGTALGQEPEAVGGSIQRIFAIFNKLLGSEKVTSKLKDFAAVSGVTVKQLREDWANNPMLAFEQFLEGFGKLTSQQQAQLFGPGELFPTFVRGQQTLQNLSAQLGTLKEGVAGATAEFARGQLIYEQSAVRFDTLKKNLQLLGNAFVEAGNTFGAGFQDEAGGAIKQLTQYIIESLPAIERFGQQIGRILTGIDWNKAKTYADAFFGTIKKGFDIVASLPPELLALLGAFKAFNFLSGGALGGITSSFASGIGGVIKNSLAGLFKNIPFLDRAFVQNVFVTNPGFGPGGGPFGPGWLATLGVIGVGLANLVALPDALDGATKVFQGIGDAIGVITGQGGNTVVTPTILSGVKSIFEGLRFNPFFPASTADAILDAIDRANPTSTGWHGPPSTGMLGPTLSQLGAIPRIGDLQEETNAILNRGANSQETAVGLLQKLLDALKPRHRAGEKGKSIQSAEFAALNRLDPSRTGDINAYLSDLIAHYKKQPIGTKGHERGFIMRGFKGIFPELKADLKAAMKTGGPGLDKLLDNLKGLKSIGIHLPPGLRHLIAKAEARRKEAKTQADDNKAATKATKSAVVDASDRIENLTAALRRKKMSTTVKPSWKAYVRAPSVRVGGPTVKVTIGARTLTRYIRGTVAYGPGLVLMQTGTGGAAYYSGGGGP